MVIKIIKIEVKNVFVDNLVGLLFLCVVIGVFERSEKNSIGIVKGIYVNFNRLDKLNIRVSIIIGKNFGYVRFCFRRKLKYDWFMKYWIWEGI